MVVATPSQKPKQPHLLSHLDSNSLRVVVSNQSLFNQGLPRSLIFFIIEQTTFGLIVLFNSVDAPESHIEVVKEWWHKGLTLERRRDGRLRKLERSFRYVAQPVSSSSASCLSPFRLPASLLRQAAYPPKSPIPGLQSRLDHAS